MVEIGQPVFEIFQKHQLVARLEDARDLEVQKKDRRSTLVLCKGPTEGAGEYLIEFLHQRRKVVHDFRRVPCDVAHADGPHIASCKDVEECEMMHLGAKMRG